MKAPPQPLHTVGASVKARGRSHRRCACLLHAAGRGRRGGRMQIAREEARDWPAQVGAGRAEGGPGPPGAQTGRGGEALGSRPPGPPRQRPRGLFRTMPPLWALLALGCLPLGVGERGRGEGVVSREGRQLSPRPRPSHSPERSRGGKQRWERELRVLAPGTGRMPAL